MILDPALIQACAPSVAVTTVQAVVAHESGGNPFAVNINGAGPKGQPKSLREAKARVLFALDHHETADMSLMQINSTHLGKNGLSLDSVFDACTNLRIGSQLLTVSYRTAVGFLGEGQQALMAALSQYNTGNFKDGITNGYVAAYYDEATAVLSASSRARAAYRADPVVFARNPKP